MANTGAAIEAFWGWWATAKDGYLRIIEEGAPSTELLREMNERVSVIHADLEWEFGRGKQAKHHFCVSAHGDGALRVIAERWLKRAPAADETWEFYSARQAMVSGLDDLTLETDGVTAALDDISFRIELVKSRERLDIVAYHPAFAAIQDEMRRIRFIFLAIDNLLGEDGVERWIGVIDAAQEPIQDGASWRDLARQVDELAARAKGECWTLMQGTVQGMPMVVTINSALKRIDHVLLDMHFEVVVPLRSRTPMEMPDHQEHAALYDMENDLFKALGEHAVRIGHEVGRGRHVIHLHAAEGGPVSTIINRWRERHPLYGVRVEARMDPNWKILERWGTPSPPPAGDPEAPAPPAAPPTVH